MKKYAQIMIMVGISLLTLPASVFSCSCGFMPPSSSMQPGGVIFIGKVIETKTDYPYLSEAYPNQVDLHQDEDGKTYRQTSTFEVLKMWRGEPKKYLKNISLPYGTCGKYFTKGKTYLYYGGQKDDQVGTSKCSRTEILKDKEIEMRMLDQFSQGISC